MAEIEQKFREVNHVELKARLLAVGVGEPTVHEEIDHYFNAPDRDFARTGEAFRLRRVGKQNYFTFKGPKQPGAVKIRSELEFPLGEGDEVAGWHLELLRLLGYREVAQVRKIRTSYRLAREPFEVHICLDEVEELGAFAEVEVLAPQEQAAKAAEVLGEVAEQLGLQQVEPRSYLSLLLAARAQSHLSTPKVVTTVRELRQALDEVRRQHLTIGFVPTMGALHEGHASLMQAARSRNDFVVVSIFVNPTQFGPNEDLARYPRPFEADVRVCAERGVDLIFHPSPEEMYPPGFRTYVEVTGIQDRFEGASRPGHFRGVATVVLKLFHQVRPDRAYFGQKDAQQVRVIQQMVRDLDVPIEIVVCPTVREADGLALSSRNRYLDAGQRANSVALFRALQTAQKMYHQGERDPEVLKRVMEQVIAGTDEAQLDYAAVIEVDSFEPAADLSRPVLLALAVRFGETRLIDNLLLG